MKIPEADAIIIKTNQPLVRSHFSVRKLASQAILTENNEPLVDQTMIVRHGLACEPFWDTPGDLEGTCYQNYINTHSDFSLSLRSNVLQRLIDAQQHLPAHWKIILKAGYRPYDVQIGLLEFLQDEAKHHHPDWTDKQALKHARTYVIDPTLGCPPHVTGGAVDLDVIDETTSKPIDMGCPPNTDAEIAFLHSDQLTQHQHENRLILLKAMLDAGFAPLVTEWWHYQYGEAYWAAFYGHPRTKYGLLKV